MLVALIIALATIENMAPLILGWVRTPPGYVFLGTVHHPADYFYYLSQFAQGSYRWLTTINLYTTEAVPASFIGWSNLLMGNIFHLIGISPMIGYHASVLLLTIILLFIAYKLAYSILNTRYSSTLALYLFVLFHAFPILRDGKPSYGDYWNNFATPFVRMGSVPHQLLLNIASILMVYSVIKKRYFVLGISSVVLASLQPVLWALIVGTIFIATLLKKQSIITILIILTSGILPVLYLTKLFGTQPFLQLKLWEAAQHNYFDAKGFILATGPIFLIAIIALPFSICPRTFQKLFVVIFSFISFALFLSPIGKMLAITHVRFMSTLTILCLSIIAAVGIKQTKFAPLILIALTLYLVPNHLTTIRLASNFEANNAYQYLARGDYNLLQKAAKLSTPTDTFLIIWPYNIVFPALTGRKTYAGHPLLTIDATTKEAQVNRFFSNDLTRNGGTNLLTANHITYIIAYAWTEFPKDLYAKIATGGSLMLLQSYSK